MPHHIQDFSNLSGDFRNLDSANPRGKRASRVPAPANSTATSNSSPKANRAALGRLTGAIPQTVANEKFESSALPNSNDLAAPTQIGPGS